MHFFLSHGIVEEARPVVARSAESMTWDTIKRADARGDTLSRPRFCGDFLLRKHMENSMRIQLCITPVEANHASAYQYHIAGTDRSPAGPCYEQGQPHQVHRCCCEALCHGTYRQDLAKCLKEGVMRRVKRDRQLAEEWSELRQE